MIKLRTIAYAITAAMVFNGIEAQAQKRADFCGTDSYEMLQERNANPEAMKNMQELEAFTRDFIKSNAKNRGNSAKIIIPIVFHLIYDAKGKGLIPDQQVYNAMKTINDDYSKLNADTAATIPYFHSRAANIGIEFRFARLDPQGNCTNGITRHEIEGTNDAGENVKKLIDAVQWDPKKYMNVWVVNNIASGAGGYAYYPGTAPAGGYGVLIRASQFGFGGVSNNDDGSVGSLTHELGHCFNLPHTWGNSNTPGAAGNCNTDDGVDDTPNTVGAQSCNKSMKPCAGDTNQFCNVQNYMDYSFCYTMFTEGQKTRMIAALNGNALSSLWSATNLVATGTNDGYSANACVPKVSNILPNNRVICAGSTVKYTEVSTNGPVTSRQWSFPGGTPSTSSDSVVVVTYNTPGLYDASLTVNNQYGSNTGNKVGAVRVVDNKPSPAPFSDSFETGVFTTNGYTTVNSGGGITWEQVSVAAHTGSNSLRLLNLVTANGTNNSFYLPAFNLIGKQKPRMTFYMAHATRNNATSSGTMATDKMSVLIQKNCAGPFTTRYTKTDTTLRTTKTTYATTTYVPLAKDWEKVTIDLTTYKDAEAVIVQFSYYSGGGNAMYIDDINIEDEQNSGTGTIDGEDLAKELELNLYPNPSDAKSSATLSFKLNGQEKVGIDVYDMLGRKVSAVQQETLMNAGDHKMDIANLQAGIYNVKISVGNSRLSRKLIVK